MLAQYDRSPQRVCPTLPGSRWASAAARPRSVAAVRPQFATLAATVSVPAMAHRPIATHTGAGHAGGGAALAPAPPARGLPGQPARRRPRNRWGQGYGGVPWVFLPAVWGRRTP